MSKLLVCVLVLDWKWTEYTYCCVLCVMDNKCDPNKLCSILRSEWVTMDEFWMQVDCDYQSINQSNFYSTNIPSKARLSGATAKSVFNRS